LKRNVWCEACEAGMSGRIGGGGEIRPHFEPALNLMAFLGGKGFWVGTELAFLFFGDGARAAFF